MSAQFNGKVRQGYEAAEVQDAALVVTISPNSPAVIAGAGPVTANQGTKGSTANAWPVVLPNASVVQAGVVTAGVSLNAVTGTGAQTAPGVDLGAARSTVTMVLTGSATAAIVNLEASVDGTTFFNATTGTSHNLSSSAFVVNSTGIAARYWRANATTVTGGNVTAKITGA